MTDPNDYKTIAIVGDLSSFGQCSGLSSVTVLEALGHEAALIPTALLSTHTGFPEPYIKKESDFLKGSVSHYIRLGLKFDALLSGYLLESSDSDSILELKKCLKSDGLFIMDPVLGDNGRLYKNMTGANLKAMLKLVKHADIIMPNTTELSFLLKEAFPEDVSKKDTPAKDSPAENTLSEDSPAGNTLSAAEDSPAEDTLSEDSPAIDSGLISSLKKLSSLGPKIVICTGVQRSSLIGAILYDRESDRVFSSFREKVPVNFSGTGDLFAAIFTGIYLKSRDPLISLEKAVYHVREAVLLTKSINHPYSVYIGKCLSDLLKEQQ